MIFPDSMPDEDMPMYLKEWALLGYLRNTDDSDVIMLWKGGYHIPCRRAAYRKFGKVWKRQNHKDAEYWSNVGWVFHTL